MKLFYFDTKGAAELSRLVLRLGGKVEFEDVRFTREEWAAKYKAISPSGQAPFLELDDGQVLTQSKAISVYCAQESGMLPTDPINLARTLELMACGEDAIKPMYTTFGISDVEERIAARKKLIAPDGECYKKMEVLDTLVGTCTDPFYCGAEVSLADLSIFVFCSTMRSGLLDGVTAKFLEEFKNIAAHRKKVASLPKVMEIYCGEQGFEP